MCVLVAGDLWQSGSVFQRWMEYRAISFILSLQPDYFASADCWHNTESLDADTG